jgi:heme/copper-type cytochrome/quinol oxidase subunit 4
MKTYSPLLLLAIAFVLFLVGISIPGVDSPIHIIFVVVAVVLGFIFYLRIFLEVITSDKLKPGERTLWTTAIVCLPVIGNILYVLIHNSVASKQTPKPEA